MKTSVKPRVLYVVSLSLFVGLGGLAPALTAQTQTVDQRVAAIKQSLAQSQAALKAYEWIEHHHSQSQRRREVEHAEPLLLRSGWWNNEGTGGCSSAEKGGRGIRGRIAENKKEELSEYMKEAVALVKSYVPRIRPRFRLSRTLVAYPWICSKPASACD